MINLEQELYQKIKQSHGVLKGQGIVFILNDKATEIVEIIKTMDTNEFCLHICQRRGGYKPYAAIEYFDGSIGYFFYGKSFIVDEDLTINKILTYRLNNDSDPVDLKLVASELLQLSKLSGDS